MNEAASRQRKPLLSRAVSRGPATTHTWNRERGHPPADATPTRRGARQGNKQGHLRRIAERTGVALEEMLFLDNEMGNCKSVAAIGVTVAYTPEGVKADVWERALAAFPAPGKIIR